MNYKFYCLICDKSFDLELSVEDYLKLEHKCPLCQDTDIKREYSLSSVSNTDVSKSVYLS